MRLEEAATVLGPWSPWPLVLPPHRSPSMFALCLTVLLPLCFEEKELRFGDVHAVEGTSGVLGEVLVGLWGAGYPHCPLLGTQLSQPSSIHWLCPLSLGRGWVPEPGCVTVLEPCAALSFGTRRENLQRF